ncbi:uncharacterized protein [Lepeophtheirus salmonis]|nr:uncharacterized protein LOC121115881 [Lepeophtheirus salmonis]XP_040565985.1 uncharacterized protein LOC121115881 [Lepeophtheirus salmonis]XP_040565986.1 uncharacterized protein LOC121115881 [Lepeophtheirus salmonis]
MIRRFYCCKIRSAVLAIGFTLLLIETASVLVTFWVMSNAESVSDSVVSWLRVRRNKFELEELEIIHGKMYFVERYLDFLAFPATFHILLMVSNLLLLSGAVFSNRILLIPWIIMYILKILIITGLLIFFLIKLPSYIFKVIIFLILCPFIIIFGFIIFVIRSFYILLRDLKLKEAMAKVYKNSEAGSSSFKPPSYVRRPSWAIRPPPSLWDADYLRQLDPRFNASTRSGRNPPNSRSCTHKKSSIFKESDMESCSVETSSIATGGKDDLQSVMTLSDKYKLQEEVHVLPPIISTESSFDSMSFYEEESDNQQLK